MPTQRERSPLLSLGTAGRTRVAQDSRIKVSEEVGPVLKAEPMAALTLATAAAAARAERVRRVEDMLYVFSCVLRIGPSLLALPGSE